MIKAYVVGISSGYEGEKVEVRYSIFDEDELIVKKTSMINYVKPFLVGNAALNVLLKKLSEFSDREIKVYINDGALFELVNGTSGTKNKELLQKAKDNIKEVAKFDDLEIINVNGNQEKLAEWDKILRP